MFVSIAPWKRCYFQSFKTVLFLKEKDQKNFKLYLKLSETKNKKAAFPLKFFN